MCFILLEKLSRHRQTVKIFPAFYSFPLSNTSSSTAVDDHHQHMDSVGLDGGSTPLFFLMQYCTLYCFLRSHKNNTTNNNNVSNLYTFSKKNLPQKGFPMRTLWIRRWHGKLLRFLLLWMGHAHL